MDALIATLTPLLAAEALKNWGAYAICLFLLGGALWLSIRQSRSRNAECRAELLAAKTEIETLRAEVATLQEKRLQDAQEMIRVAKAGTETMAARAAADAEFRENMRRWMASSGALPMLPADPRLLGSPS